MTGLDPIVNYTRSRRLVPPGAGDAPVPPAGRAGLRVRRAPAELGEDRVCLRDENGGLFSLPAGWTDAVAADPFVVIAAGRCPFTTDDLLAVADLVDRFCARRDSGRDVKTITP